MEEKVAASRVVKCDGQVPVAVRAAPRFKNILHLVSDLPLQGVSLFIHDKQKPLSGQAHHGKFGCQHSGNKNEVGHILTLGAKGIVEQPSIAYERGAIGTRAVGRLGAFSPSGYCGQCTSSFIFCPVAELTFAHLI